jgi:putative ribosome biogenesis GTPase RsgA
LASESLIPRKFQNFVRPEYTSTVKSEISENSLREEVSIEMKALNDARLSGLAKPVHFNVVIAGNSGIGKSTFITSFLDLKFNRIP